MLEVAAALLVGVIVGVIPSLYAQRRVERLVGLLSGEATAQARLAADSAAKLQAAQHQVILELAHKVSAPEQASVDHVFEAERAKRGALKTDDARKAVEAELERTLAARGLTPDVIDGARELM